jgi:hypothetical protein
MGNPSQPIPGRGNCCFVSYSRSCAPPSFVCVLFVWPPPPPSPQRATALPASPPFAQHAGRGRGEGTHHVSCRLQFS